MKATAKITTSAPVALIEHNGEELEFAINVYGKTTLMREDPFLHINLYWAELPQEEQQKIFNLYKEMYAMFDEFHNKEDLFESLNEKVTELLVLHNLDHIKNWVAFRSNIKIPDNIKKEFITDIDSNKSRELTYVQSEYMDLITLSLALRCMVPVWGEYINSTRQEFGTRHKEMYAFQLINKSNIRNCVPMCRMMEYIEAAVGTDIYDNENIHKGISSQDYCYWMLALVCVRRLCVGQLMNINPYANLCTSVYNFITQKSNTDSPHPESNVKTKDSGGGGRGDQDKISVLERYRYSADLSPGQIVELEFSMKDIENVAYQLCGSIDINLFNRSLETSAVLVNERLSDPQITLMRWVLKPVISTKGILYLPKELQARCLGLTEAILWSRGHKYLAILASSYAATSDQGMMVSPTDHRKRVPPEMEAELAKWYPFTKTNFNRRTGPQVENLCMVSINLLSDQIGTNSWRPSADEQMVTDVLGSYVRRIPIRPDLKLDLTRLAIELGSRNWL